MNDGMIQHFQQLYSSMDTDELVALQGKGSLRPEAEGVLDLELQKRGITAVQRSEIAAELADTSYDEQVVHHAPIGSRIMARLIDTVICLAIAAAVAFVSLSLSQSVSGRAPFLLIPMAFFAYLLFADCMPGGRSFGKKWNDIAVVDEESYAPCSALQSLGRNACLATLGILDVALVLGHRGQRIGDRLARTRVVKAEYVDNPPRA